MKRYDAEGYMLAMRGARRGDYMLRQMILLPHIHIRQLAIITCLHNR